MNSLYRLLRYAQPYKGRLAWALAAMLIYASASALLTLLIQVIFDDVLQTGQRLVFVTSAVVGLYFAKGVGGYFSDYLMEDVGQRVVRDLRDKLYGHIQRDPRHKDVVLLDYEEISERRFGGWTMGQVNLLKLNHSILLKYSEKAELDPYAASGKVSLALLEELMATASIMGRA